MTSANVETFDVDRVAHELHTRIRMVETAADLAIKSGMLFAAMTPPSRGGGFSPTPLSVPAHIGSEAAMHGAAFAGPKSACRRRPPLRSASENSVERGGITESFEP